MKGPSQEALKKMTPIVWGKEIEYVQCGALTVKGGSFNSDNKIFKAVSEPVEIKKENQWHSGVFYSQFFCDAVAEVR